MDITRRGFLKGCSATIAAMAGARFNTLAFADPGVNSEILIVLFLRGGMDGLSFLLPIDGPDRGLYEAARPMLKIPVNETLALSSQLGLHPAAMPLFDIYQDSKLAIVQNVGMPSVITKSHFDAMSYIELGTPGNKTTSTGWITRHLETANNLPSDAEVLALAVGALQPQSLAGYIAALNLADPASFHINNGRAGWSPIQLISLASIYEAGDTWLHRSGRNAIAKMTTIAPYISGTYVPANNAVYPEGSIGDHLQVVAQMIKADLGLQVATVDLGGWDTHNGQGMGSQGYFHDLLLLLSSALAAFYQDLNGAGASNYTDRLTIVVQSEFGREVRENNDNGTEHGYGNVMLVMGGHTNGGLHGTWSGLDPSILVDGTDLPVTTDYRRVLSEILVRRMGNSKIAEVFPGFTCYQPVGVVQGVDSPFCDGFESGNTSAWSSQGG